MYTKNVDILEKIKHTPFMIFEKIKYGGHMKAVYTGSYRTRLTSQEKKTFRRLAIAQGEITQVHDDLIRQYITKKEKEVQRANCFNT